MAHFIVFCLLISAVKSRELTAQEYAALPKLFDLDDYHECLSNNDGLYCLGTFHLKPANDQEPVYKLMEEYSRNKFTFNRTLIHRGYCLSRRCPSTTSNATLRFEQCVKKWAKDRGLYSTLQKLDYCKHRDKFSRYQDLDSAQKLFIYVVLIILLLNILGTVCDVTNRSKDGLSRALLVWSIPSNWKKLTTIIYEEKNTELSAFAPMQGTRVFILAVVLLVHAKYMHYLAYLQNPQDFEKGTLDVATIFFFNGTTLVQIFVIFSSLLFTFNMLKLSEKKPISLSSVPSLVLKRIIRVAPVQLLVIGFGATWHAYINDGPLWPALIEKEQRACREKFWTYTLFINNFVEPEKKCYLQTWFLAVDIQLYIFTLLMIIFLSRMGRGILKILIIIYFTLFIVIIALAYQTGWQSMLYASTPETMHAYYNTASFEQLYATPLGNILSCLTGLILAHLQYSVQKDGIQVHNWKWLVYTHNFSIPIYVAWVLSGVYIRDTFTAPIALAMYVGVERLVFNVVISILIFGYWNIDTPMRRFWAWRGWDVFAQLSLPVLMIHWAVNMTIVASRPNLLYSTGLSQFVDASATWVITYALAVPIWILVEIPMRRLFSFIY